MRCFFVAIKRSMQEDQAPRFGFLVSERTDHMLLFVFDVVTAKEADKK